MNHPQRERRETKEYLLARRIAEKLLNSDMIHFKQTQEVLAEKIEARINAEFQIEVKLDVEVKALLEKYEKEIDRGVVDARKMFLMIKKKLTQDRGLILWSDPTLSQEDKINHLAHIVQKGIMGDAEIKIKGEAVSLLQVIKQGIILQIQREAEVQALVRNQLAARSVLEGSEEWDLLYRKTYAEIAKKRGASF